MVLRPFAEKGTWMSLRPLKKRHKFGDIKNGYGRRLIFAYSELYKNIFAITSTGGTKFFSFCRNRIVSVAKRLLLCCIPDLPHPAPCVFLPPPSK